VEFVSVDIQGIFDEIQSALANEPPRIQASDKEQVRVQLRGSGEAAWANRRSASEEPDNNIEEA